MMTEDGPGMERLFTSAEVAKMARVSPRTVSRWARSGLLEYVPMPGGRRFRESVVKALLTEGAVK
ncbi:helix-turn-helix domain-containing protein [Actinomadura sp. NPDC047616]|uniref:helix-turn-helix domain-containing protein n=1 Tax=Actinomadura sp. NPDC047616 TaxID=3155914 RepID=UPI003402DF67